MALAMTPEALPKSVSPEKGRGLPAWDEAYLAFRRRWEAEVNAKWLDRHTRFGADLPDREPIDGKKFDLWLYEKAGGTKINIIELANYQHRLRFLAITLRDRPDTIHDLARIYESEATQYED